MRLKKMLHKKINVYAQFFKSEHQLSCLPSGAQTLVIRLQKKAQTRKTFPLET